jgi:CHAD domain-containing protein
LNKVMKRDTIIHVFGKRFKKIRKHYYKLLEDFDAEEVHDFRLEIKKLRAFIRLVNKGLPEDEPLKMEKNLKTFYSSTGNLRNLELHQQRINLFCEDLLLEKPELYFQVLKKEGDQLKENARQLAGMISLNGFEKKIRNALPDKLKPSAIDDFILEKKCTLRAFISLQEHQEEILHEIRKILKDMLYDWVYLDLDATTTFPASLAHPDVLKDLTVKLGDFHDLTVSLLFLEPSHMEKVMAAPEFEREKELLYLIRQQLEGVRDELKKELRAILYQVKLEWEDTFLPASSPPGAEEMIS